MFNPINQKTQLYETCAYSPDNTTGRCHRRLTYLCSHLHNEGTFIYQVCYILYSYSINVTFYAKYMEGGGRGSIVGMATPCGLQSRRSNPGGGENFRPRPERP
jgi:hypothetical protein